MHRLTARLPEELTTALFAQAEADNMPVAEIVRRALARHLKVSLPGVTRTFHIPPPQYNPDSRPATTVTVPVNVVDDILVLLRAGQVINAIKGLRTWSMEVPGGYEGVPGAYLGLYEAKTVIDILRAEEGR